jgi:hypothetical protein
MMEDDNKVVNLMLECPECGERFSFSLYMNGDEKMKKDILSRKIFTTHCPNCDTTAILYNDFLYTDEEHHIVISMGMRDELLIQKQTIVEADKDSEPSEDDATFIGVSSLYDLFTAIMCADNNLDYRVARLVLFSLKNEYIKSNPDKSIETLGIGDHHNKEGQLLYSVYTKADDEIVYDIFPMDRYNEYLSLFKDKLDKADMFIFDDDGCAFFLNHLNDIDNDSREETRLFLTYADNGVFLVSPTDNIQVGDNVLFQVDEQDVIASVENVLTTNTIALGRELSSIPTAELYIEGGAC